MSWCLPPRNPFLPRRGETYRHWVLSGQRARYGLWIYCAPCRSPWPCRC